MERPAPAQIYEEWKRERYRRRYRQAVRSTVYTLVVVAAIAVLVATLWMPGARIYGNSMTPTLNEGEYVVRSKAARISGRGTSQLFIIIIRYWLKG